MTPPAPTPEAKVCPSCDQYTGGWCVWLDNVRLVHGIHEHEAKALVDMWATAHARGRAEGLEAAAQGAKSWEPEWQITVQEAFVRQEIAAALRALRRPPSPREEKA